MRQSGLMGLGAQGDRINVSVRNRTRLILQNRKLLAQVYKLEQLISTIIERSAAEQWTGIEESQEMAQKYRGETDQQQRAIARLKKEIKAVKATLADHKYIEAKNEENQVTFLRRECDRLMQEKETLAQQKREKEGALEYHQPINQQTASTLELYKKTKASNGQLKAKIHQLQREVAKYHQMKQMAKSSVPKQYDNPDYELIKMDNEIASMRKEMRRIEEKWRAKVEAIDKEFFSFKDIRQRKVGEVQALEKEARNHENHVSAMRDEMAVASDRERISGVVISPQKRREMQELIEDEKMRLKRLSPKAPQNKQRAKSKTFDKSKPNKTQNELKLIPASKQEANLEKMPQQSAAQYELTHYSEKKNEEVAAQVRLGKGKKMLESVGVGTSFYYADD